MQTKWNGHCPTLVLTVLNVNGATVPTTLRQTEVSILPEGGLERKVIKITGDGRLITVVYKILNKEKTGEVTLSVVNPYGQVIKTVDIPEKSGGSTLTRK